MNYKKLLQYIISITLLIFFVVGCTTETTPISEVPVTTPTVVPATNTPTPNPPTATLTPEPPTATLTPEPSTATLTPEPPTATLTPEPPTATLTPESPTATLSPEPPTANPNSSTTFSTGPNVEWLITAEDLNKFSNDIGIVQWELDEELLGEFRICRFFSGVSWSVNPNAAMNCVNDVTPIILFEEVIQLMYEIGVLYPSDIELTPNFSYDYDFALYAHNADNGHSFYDAFLLHEGVLFRATVSVGTPGGDTLETLFDEQGEIIETFLYNMLLINMEKHD